MGMNTNCMKLRTLFLAFDLLTSNVAEACDVSRPYVARILSEKDHFSGSPQFWRKVENNLGKIIEARRANVFEVAAAPCNQIETLKSALKPAA